MRGPGYKARNKIYLMNRTFDTGSRRSRELLLLSLSLFCYALGRPVLAADAPVTTAGRITNAVPGTAAVAIPITVTNFTNIGQLKLTMTFSTELNLLRFVSANSHPALPGMTVTYTEPALYLGQIVLAWTGPTNVSLPDGASLADLTFAYGAGTQILVWNTYDNYGTWDCLYARYETGLLSSLSDTPKALFYRDGIIADRTAPVTFAPVISNPAVGPLALPLVVHGFTNIGAISLSLDYDPAVIAYQGTYTVNPALAGSFGVGDNATADGKRQIRVSWFTYPTGVSLPNGSTLCTWNFIYLTNGTTTTLNWNDGGQGTFCEYADAPSGNFTPLIDTPTADYFKNGRVGLAPVRVLQITNAALGFATISWAPPASNFVLQETSNPSLTNWNNSPSGPTNPATVPITGPARFYRLLETGP